MNYNGITIIIVTYKRNSTLLKLLKSILGQQINIPIEIYIINNWHKQILQKNILTPVGRVLRKIDDIKVINNSENMGCSFRYSLATYSKYETILLLDDDIELLDNHFISRMYNFLHERSDIDIVSCWCSRFNHPKIDYFDTESFSFLSDIEGVHEVDLIGPGVSMFNKKILFSDLVNIPEKYRDVDNIWFSIMPTVLLGSKKYYFPSYGMLQFIKDHGKEAMCRRDYMRKLKDDATNELVAMGYVPVSSQ